MLWAGSEAQLYLASRSVSWRPDAKSAVLRCEGETWAGALDALKAQLSGLRRSRWRGRLRVWLSGGLARPFLLEPVAGLKTRAEAVQLARAVAAEATGLGTGCEVWLDAWRPGAACVAVAVQENVLEALRLMADDTGMRLVHAEPWWNWALSREIGLAGGAMKLLAIEEEDAVTVFANRDDQWASVHSQSPKPPPDRVEAHVRRYAASQGRGLADVCTVAFSPDLQSEDNAELAPLGWARRQQAAA